MPRREFGEAPDLGDDAVIPPYRPVIDLMEALKQSLRKAPEQKAAGTRKARKKA